MEFNRLINPVYVSPNVVHQMSDVFKASRPNVLLLNSFFNLEGLKVLESSLKKATRKENDSPASHSYIELGLPTECTSVFSSNSFLSFVQGVTGIRDKRIALSVKQFGHRHYTLIHDEQDATERLLFFYIFAPQWKGSWGGSSIFTFAHGKTEPLVFTPNHNTFVIMRAQKGMYDFVKYVSNHAGKNSFVKIEGILS